MEETNKSKKLWVYWPYFVRTGRTGRMPRGPRCSRVSCRRVGSRTASWAGKGELTWRERWWDPPGPWCDPFAGCSWQPCQQGARGHLSEGRWHSRFGADVAHRRGSAGPSPEARGRKRKSWAREVYLITKRLSSNLVRHYWQLRSEKRGNTSVCVCVCTSSATETNTHSDTLRKSPKRSQRARSTEIAPKRKN